MSIKKRKLEIKTLLTFFSSTKGMQGTLEYKGVLLNLTEGSRYEVDESHDPSRQSPSWIRKSYVVRGASTKYLHVYNPDIDTDVLSVNYILSEE